MKKSGSMLAILGLLALASPAIAQDQGIYLGGSLGYTQYKSSCKRATVPCDDRDDAWRLLAGYQFNRHWSAEVGYGDLGAATGSGANGFFAVKTKAWDLSALASIPVAGGLSALLRLGMYRARTTIDQQGPGVVTPHAAGTNSGFTFGAGVGYNLWKLGLRAEWQRYDGVGTGDIGKDDIDVFSLGALFRF
jgi:OOP family OmpA-OmpF porin